MGIFFGTDGIRGVVNDFLNLELASKCGNAVARSKPTPKIVIGGDTRITREYLTCGFAGGAMSAGAFIVDVGICPTAGIAFLTKKLNFDYGVVISASHNPPQFNGIKIFDNNGFKLSDKAEEELERKFINQYNVDCNNIGKYTQNFSLVKLYQDFLVQSCKTNLSGLTILLDCSNGASYKIAPAVFKKLGAKVIATNCCNNGNNINSNCGSTCPQTLAKAVKKFKPDMGFAFDGDSDRIIACDQFGNILDGDIIIYMLAKYLKQNNKLANNSVVGTRHTNMGIEKSLNKDGINFVRTDIGDKYVIAKINEQNLSLGGEKSGHIIFKEYSTTGDGILTAIILAEMVKFYKKSLNEICSVELYPQCNIDCTVEDKMKIINSEELCKVIETQEKLLGDGARIMVRVSGTEPKIRIMVECNNIDIAIKSAKEIEKIVYKVDKK